MKMENNERLDEIVEYSTNLKQINLWPIEEADRIELYNDIRKLFDENKLTLELRFINEIISVNSRKRISFYNFERGESVHISYTEDAPTISVKHIDQIIIKNKAYCLANLINENLGVELSIEEL